MEKEKQTEMEVLDFLANKYNCDVVYDYMNERYTIIASSDVNQISFDEAFKEFMTSKGLEVKTFSTEATWCTSTCKSNSEERMDVLNEAFDSSSLEETVLKMKIKELEMSIKLRDLEIEKLMNKLNNK